MRKTVQVKLQELVTGIISSQALAGYAGPGSEPKYNVTMGS